MNYHQITLEEVGIIPEKKYSRKQYATPCGGCICNHCANNVDCIDHMEKDELMKAYACFNCDECISYDGKGTDNWKPECERYEITYAYARQKRKQFLVI